MCHSTGNWNSEGKNQVKWHPSPTSTDNLHQWRKEEKVTLPHCWLATAALHTETLFLFVRLSQSSATMFGTNSRLHGEGRRTDLLCQLLYKSFSSGTNPQSLHSTEIITYKDLKRLVFFLKVLILFGACLIPESYHSLLKAVFRVRSELPICTGFFFINLSSKFTI